MINENEIARCVRRTLDGYFRDLDGERPAGIYDMVQPEAARELGRRKAANVLATGPGAYATANPGCLIQVTAQLRREARPLPAFHPIELVDAAIRDVPVERVLAGARR